MVVFKILTAYTLLSLITLSSAISLKQPIFTNSFDIRQHLSATVAVESDLFTISYNSSHIRIKSSDKYYKTCAFPVEKFSENRLRAAVLGNKRRFVVWTIYQSQFHNRTVEVQSKMFIVDPWRCLYKFIPLSSDYQPRWYQRINLGRVDYAHEAQVVTYTDSFDVFFAGPNVCSPCRFNVDGDEIKMQYQIEADGFDAMETSYIQGIELKCGSRGYLQLYRFVNFTAALKILDANFKVLKQTSIYHSVSLIDVDRSEKPTTGVCYLSSYPKAAKGDLKYVYCKKYDSDLDRLFTIRLPMAVEAYPPGFTLTLDSLGHIFVTYEAPYANSTKLAFFEYDELGNLTRSLDFSDPKTPRKVALSTVLTSDDYCLVSLVRRDGRDICNKVVECIKI